MARWLRLILIAVVALALLLIAGANRDLVTLHLLPPEMARFAGTGDGWQVPLFLVLFATLLIGFGLGLLWEFVRERGHRVAARDHRQQAAILAREVKRLKGPTGPADEVLAILDQPKA